MLPLYIKNASLAFRIASLFELISSRGISSKLFSEWPGRVKLSETADGLIDVTLYDGFLYCASVFSKSIAKATFSFPYVLDPAFGALYHVHEVRRRAGDVMPYTFLLVSSEESVRRGSFFNKTARFTPSSVTTVRSRCQGGWSAVFGPD